MKPARCVACTWCWVWLSAANWIQNKEKTVSYAQFQAAWPVSEQRSRTVKHLHIRQAERKKARQTERSEDDWENEMQIGGKRERVSGGQLCQCTGILGLSKALIFVGLGAIGQVQRSLSSRTAQDFILSLRASPTSGLDGRSNQPLLACHHRLISDAELVINVRAPELTSHPSTDSLLIHFCTIIGENVYHW